jgi:DMSO/TMAO reductase YedYZ molybdopterin-dependent catalytic subunit
MDTDSDGTNYFESIDLIDAVHPQTILAYELNDQPLPVDNGAPLRLRVETQLGYKHAKYIRALEFVASLDKIGQGKGGYWEDQGLRNGTPGSRDYIRRHSCFARTETLQDSIYPPFVPETSKDAPGSLSVTG